LSYIGTQPANAVLTASDIADGIISTAKLATNSVTGVKITDNVISGEKLLFTEITLTDGSTISWNAATAEVCKVTLAGNRTMAAPSNSTTGQFISILVIQDGTGGRTISWNAVFEFTTDTAPTLTATASKGDVFVFRYNGAKWLEVGRNLNLTLS
tara:strand:- start:222 stop:686 length:465 start_codon:yes stop_codon:yes gene_type:complete